MSENKQIRFGFSNEQLCDKMWGTTIKRNKTLDQTGNSNTVKNQIKEHQEK